MPESPDDAIRPGPPGELRPRDWWRQEGGAGDERKAQQVRLIQQAFEKAGTPIGIYPSDDRPQDMEYMYRRMSVLARDVDAERVQRALGVSEPTVDKRRLRGGLGRANGETPVSVSGLTLIELPPSGVQHDFADDTQYWFSELDAILGVGVAVPDHVVHISPNAGGCPATEPLPSAGPPQPPVDEDPSTDGRSVKVVVIDTGLAAGVVDEHHWLDGVTGDPEPPSVGHYRGHGSFVAGVLRTMAPASEVHVRAFFVIGGAILESDLAVKLESALDEMPDIISMSAGTTTRGGLPLLALENFWVEHLSRVKGTVLVAAAGNDGNRGPFYPAAFPWSVSVGALEADGTRAGYSNHGSWVDVYARGSDMVNAFPRGWYQYFEDPYVGQWSHFLTGMASWDGTSFSTPLVSGLIAGRMTWSGENARDAAAALLAIARAQARVGVGAVLEPGDAAPPGLAARVVD